MAKEYGLMMYLPSSQEWLMDSEQFDDQGSPVLWSSATYPSATIGLQTLNNMLGWEVEAVWTQTVGYQNAKLDHPMPVYLLSHPAEHVYRPDSTSPKPSVKIW